MKCQRKVSFLEIRNIWHEWKQAYFESALLWELSFSLTFYLSYTDNRHVLQEYVSRLPTSDDTDTSILACFLVYHSIPSFRKMATTDLEGKKDIASGHIYLLSVCIIDISLIIDLKTQLIFSFSGCSSFPELLLTFSQLGVPVQGLLHLSPLLLHNGGSAISQPFPSDHQKSWTYYSPLLNYSRDIQLSS